MDEIKRSWTKASDGQIMRLPAADRFPTGEKPGLTGTGEDRGPRWETDAESGAPQRRITQERLREWTRILQKYKAGKAHLERRVVAAESWWKLRNQYEEQKEVKPGKETFLCKSGWLHNVIVSKHADAMEAFPEPVFLPREPGDREQARMLSSVVPCILEQNHFEEIYSDAMWQKLKTGTAAYMIVWDQSKLNGLGDVSIQRVDLLNLFWEPGVSKIQDSRHLFYTYLEDREELLSRYPQMKEIKGDPFHATKFLYDDHVDTTDKATVINHYYHRYDAAGRRVLHYCKYVGDQVLFSTEEQGDRGLYDHGLYPFVLDPLFPVEGSPCGYGFVDLGSNSQTQIDLLKTAYLKNSMAGATPRYFFRQDGSVNEAEFLDLSKPLVHVTGNLGEDSLRVIQHNSLEGNYIQMLDQTIRELRETTGNTESANGVSNSGATAASAIAALQEASGKGSRDSTRASYRAFCQICELIEELIRQFYDLPRRFRIMGEDGEEQFATFSNDGIRPQHQGMIGTTDMGYRLPVFDIKVTQQKRNSYARISQNELAMELYGAGVLDPANAEQAGKLLEMMDFEGKEELQRKVVQQGSLYEQMTAFRQLALALAAKYEPERARAMMQSIEGQGAGGRTPASEIDLQESERPQEHGLVRRARQQSAEAGLPG